MAVTMNRAARRAQKIEQGPDRDPIRQQGRDPKYRYDASDWYTTKQPCDRSRAVRQPRKYHVAYRTSSGHSPDEHFERMAKIAAEFEAAGINLGWGRCSRRGHCETVQEHDRRYAEPPKNRWATRAIQTAAATPAPQPAIENGAMGEAQQQPPEQPAASSSPPAPAKPPAKPKRNRGRPPSKMALQRQAWAAFFTDTAA